MTDSRRLRCYLMQRISANNIMYATVWATDIEHAQERVPPDAQPAMWYAIASSNQQIEPEYKGHVYHQAIHPALDPDYKGEYQDELDAEEGLVRE